jgi:uncharacterized membrane protein YbhN (UPF0104 family)
LLLVLAGVASFLAIVAYGCIWPIVLRLLGAPVPSDALGIFLQSQLGKYVPGSVWHYAGRVGLARRRGVPARATLSSLGVEVGASALAAAVVATFVLPLRIAVPLTLVLIGIVALVLRLRRTTRIDRWLARRVTLEGMSAAARSMPTATALYLPVWAVYGVALWLTARAFFPIPADELLFFTGAFALGWLVGMVVVFAPGGIGVREAVLVAVLGPRIGHPEAIVVAAASRILLTSADVAGGALALALARRSRPAGDRPLPHASGGRTTP